MTYEHTDIATVYYVPFSGPGLKCSVANVL
jgi:hypothetical protein